MEKSKRQMLFNAKKTHTHTYAHRVNWSVCREGIHTLLHIRRCVSYCCCLRSLGDEWSCSWCMIDILCSFFLSLFFAMLFCCSAFWLLLERMFVVLSFECYLVRSNHWHSVDFECSKAIDPFAQHSVLIQICLAIHRNLNVSGSEWEKPKITTVTTSMWKTLHKIAYENEFSISSKCTQFPFELTAEVCCAFCLQHNTIQIV